MTKSEASGSTLDTSLRRLLEGIASISNLYKYNDIASNVYKCNDIAMIWKIRSWVCRGVNVLQELVADPRQDTNTNVFHLHSHVAIGSLDAHIKRVS